MFFISFLKISSILLAIVGGLFSIPLLVAIFNGETQMILPFVIPMLVSFVFCFVVTLSTRKIKFSMSIKQTFVIVAMSWVVMSFLGSVPLFMSGYFASYMDALFESVSGFTTTGATILSEVENLPRSVNMLRCLTHWIGGMGIVTLTVALMPLLGVGGFQLIKAETTGPEKGKVTARITTTAKVLWIIYLGFTVAETIALKLAGMDFVDALSHAFATLGTGGFSTRNASIGTYNSLAVEIIITVFMFLAGINFSLFVYLFQGKVKDIFSNAEFKAYLGILLVSFIGITISVIPYYGGFGKSLRYSSFQAVSIMTTTGFGTADYLQWPVIAQFFLFMLFFVGGCSGSTSGGIKVVRWVVLTKQLNNETKRMLHPHGIFTIRLNGKVSSKDIVLSVTSFMFLYFVMIAISVFIGCLGKLDILSSATGALSMVGNVGPAFGILGPTANYGALPAFVKLWYCFAMLAGRLELYTMIIFFMPSYWKK
ncbi:MAG: TrkH family potassium uptake protein [Treponema sp.]|nr:TrkH family potassium uptake protein [Treponema sp.]